VWTRRTRAILAALGAAAIVTLIIPMAFPTAQAPSSPTPRLPDGKPNLNGIWQANNTANWDVLAHPARQGPMTALGAAFSIPGGLGVVEGNEIPYKPEMLAKKQQNAQHWTDADPEIKCYQPG